MYCWVSSRIIRLHCGHKATLRATLMFNRVALPLRIRKNMPYVFNLKDLVVFQGSQYAKIYSKKKILPRARSSLPLMGSCLGTFSIFKGFGNFSLSILI